MKKKTFLMLSIALVAVVLAAVGTSYALFRFKILDGNNFSVVVGNLQLDLSDEMPDGQVVVEELIPMKDSTAMQQSGYSFTITNTGSIDSVYSIYIDDVVPSGINKQRVPDSLMRANLYNKTTGKKYTFSLENNRILETISLSSGESNEYELRLWLAESATATEQNKYYAAKIRVNGVQDNSVQPLSSLVFEHSKLNNSAISLDTSSKLANENGLYKVDVTNGFGGSNGTTYFYRGNVTNNYVNFAGFTWRIVRINEDGTIRLILENSISNDYNIFGNDEEEYNGYYSNSTLAKPAVDLWYQTNILNNGYDDAVAKGNYFCEAAKVMWENSNNLHSTPIGNANMVYKEDYTPTLTCQTDANGYGLLNSKVGLITYDEIAYAGGQYPFAYYDMDYYMMNDETQTFTMSNGGYDDAYLVEWLLHQDGRVETCPISNSIYCESSLRPVINLKADVKVWGHGTTSDPYKVVMQNKNVKVASNIDLIISQFNQDDLKDVIMCDQSGTGNNIKYNRCSIYNTIDEALASRDKGIIILTDDIELTSTKTIVAGKEITLDLNGHNINYTSSNDVAMIKNSGILTINDSKDGGSFTTNYRIIQNFNNLTINAGKFIRKNESSTDGGVIGTYSNSNVVINGGTFSCDKCWVVFTGPDGNSNVTINDGYFESVAASIIVNREGVITINNGKFITELSADVYNYSTKTINVNGGVFISKNNSSIINSTTGTININQTTTPIYVTTLAESWKPAIVNAGTLNITASQADKCTENSTDTTSGLCIYAVGDRNMEEMSSNTAVESTGSGVITINGGTYYGGRNSVRNSSTNVFNIKNAKLYSIRDGVYNNSNSTINVCNITHISNGHVDLAINAEKTGTINYTSDCIFKNGTNTPDIYNPAGTVNQISTCPF